MATSENLSEVSEFYIACRNGDVQFVKHYLKNLSDPKCQPNHFEPSVKNTPLHAASYYGHKEIVQLLLQHECDRSQLNGYGLTAFEEAANDEIRALFKRPPDKDGMHRFVDESVHGWFDFVKQPKEKVRIRCSKRE